MTHFKTLLLALTSITVSQTALAQTVNTPFQAQKVAHDLMRLNSGLLYGQKQKYGDIFSRIGSRFEMTEVNPELVRRHEQKFARESAYLNRTIKRSEPYLHYVATEVERRNMPGEIALLPYIESAFVIKAKSPVGASGLWQFMPATGKQYGLEQNNIYDGRHDVYAATDSALNYLEYLYGLFGDWSLALAAYNWGEGNVARAVKRAEGQGLLPTYENLKMPQETRNYAPKLLAWRNVVSNPAAFGVSIPNIEDEAYFEAVDVSTPIDMAAAARLAGISQDEFLRLNPGFNVPVFFPTAKRKMLLPKNAVNHFVRNYQAADSNQLLSYNIYTPMGSEKVQDVAASFGMSDSELKQLNGIRSSQLSAGTPVLVAKNRQPLTNANVNQPGIEGDFNLAQFTPVAAFRQADALAKPKAQIAEVKPVKIRATRPQATIQQDFTAPMANQNFLAQAAQPDLIAQTATAAVEEHSDNDIVFNTTSNSAPIQIAAATPVAYSAPVQVAYNTAPNTNEAPISFATVAKQPAVNLLASNKTRATAAVESDPLLALMNKRPVNTTPVLAAVAPVATPTAVANQEDYAANVVRDTIARENAREAREQDRIARVRAETEKRERQLASASQHKVETGDTLYSIAKTYDMNVQDLLAANGLSGNTIKVGQSLKVGKAADRAIQLAKDDVAKQAPQQQQSQMNYVVRKGDTLNSIAGKFNVKVNDLRQLNTNTNLRPGQKIQLRQL